MRYKYKLIMIFSYANGILTVNLYKAVDQAFIEEADAELVTLLATGVMDEASVTVSVAQILTVIPAPLAAVIGVRTYPVIAALLWPVTSDQSGQIDSLK